jgi:hypothetical protein
MAVRRRFHFYLDTEKKLDFIYELANRPVQDLPPRLYTIYPPGRQ